MNQLLTLTFWCLFICCCPLWLTAQEAELIVDNIEEEYRLAVEKMAAHQYEQALQHIYSCKRVAPKNIDYTTKLGFCYFKLGNFPDAKLCYQQILKQDSTNVNALSNLALIYDREFNYKKADAYYQELIELDATNSYYFKQIAYVAVKRKAITEALRYFGRAHELNVKDITIIREMANLYLSSDAMDYAKQMVEKGYLLDSMNIRLLYTKAKVENREKQYDRVIKTVNKAMAQGDTTIYYQTMLGVAYLQEDSLDAAQFHFERLLAQKKASEHIHHYLALIYDKKGDQEKSAYHLERAISEAVSEKLPIYCKDLAAIFEAKKDYRNAVKYYKMAYEWSEKEIYLFYLARAQDFYYKDKNIAMRSYKKYLASNPAEHREYTSDRISQLKQLIHFQKK